MKKGMVALTLLAAIAGGFYFGRMSNATTVPEKVASSQVGTSAIEKVDGLVIPAGLTVPDNLPKIKVDNPTAVLTGEMKMPEELLRGEIPPPATNLVIPAIPIDKK